MMSHENEKLQIIDLDEDIESFPSNIHESIEPDFYDDL